MRKNGVCVCDDTVYAETFTDADLSSSQKTITHNLNTKYFSSFIVFDSSNTPVSGLTLTPVDANSATLDLTGFGTISGQWIIVISAGTPGFAGVTSEVTFGGDSVTFGGDTVTW